MTDETIWIESTRDAEGTDATCLIRWDGIERYAPVADVRRTAEDLFTCAAYADLIGELLRIGIGPTELSGLTSAMVSKRQPRYFGAPTTLYMLPGGSSALKQGRVLLAHRNRFHEGTAATAIGADEARTMGQAWFAVAEASEADTLFGAVLRRSGWMGDAELEALFTFVRDIRGGNAELPPDTGAS